MHNKFNMLHDKFMRKFYKLLQSMHALVYNNVFAIK